MGWLNNIFATLDPIHDKLDPFDAWMQEQVMGNQERQNVIAPLAGSFAVDYFAPGWGAAMRAGNSASEGDWTGAAINGVGAYMGMSSAPATAGTSGLEATNATQATQATQGLEGTSGLASTGNTMPVAGSVSTGEIAAQYQPNNGGLLADVLDKGSTKYTGMTADVLDEGSTGYVVNYDRGAGAHGYGLYNEVPNTAQPGQIGHGWKYTDQGYATSPDGKVFFQGDQLTGAGGKEMGLLDYAGKYADKANRAINSADGKQVMKAGGMVMQQQASQDAQARQRAAMQQQRATPAPADFSTMNQRPAASFQTLSPYASFQGGFNPRRTSNRGLLG